jgi:hypothetical protein
MLAPKQIDRISSPDRKTFFNNYLYKNTPVVITGLVDEWPALHKWDLAYFIKNFGNVEVDIIPLKTGTWDFDLNKGATLSKSKLSDCMLSDDTNSLKERIAIAQPINTFPDSIFIDYKTLDFCASGKFLRSFLFVSPKGSRTLLHKDLPENLYVQIKGTRKVTLFHPNAPIYKNSIFSKLPTHSFIDPEFPDYGKYPRFKNAQPYEVVLHPGETLFIPSFWWHHLSNIESSIAMNFWWSYGWKLPIAWAAATYKKWRTI